VRDLAAVYQWLLADLGAERAALVGLGFGGWIAAEMASLAPAGFSGLVLVGAMGLKPPEGEILDQALLNHVAYLRAGFQDPTVCDAVFGAEPPIEQLEAWEINRDMVFRIAWRPYMFNPTLPHLLGRCAQPRAGRLGTRRPHRAAERRRGLRAGVAAGAARDHRGLRPLGRDGAARRARPARD